MKEIADQTFVNEIRYIAANLMQKTYLVGLNTAVFSYLLVFRKLKHYIALPLTFTTYILARNFSMKHCMNHIYYPLYPVYREVRAVSEYKEVGQRSQAIE